MKISISERIRTRREALGMTQDELAQRLGFKSRTSITKIESGNRELRQKNIKDIADALDTTPGYIMGWDDTPDITPYVKPKKKIPLIGAVACGTPILAHENIEREVSCPDDIDADFCLRCRGDSMTGARIMDGDIVFIHAQDDVDDGQIAVVAIPTAEGEAEATLKRVYHNPDGSVTLMAENPLYRPLVLRDARIEGRAVAFLSKVV